MADEVTLAQPPATRGRRARYRRALGVVGWVVLAAVWVGAVAAGVHVVRSDRGGDRPLRAGPGDCFAGDSDTDLRPVQCDDPAVRWTVAGVVEGQSRADARQQTCRAWPEAQASYWESRNGQTGYVLCLRPVRSSGTPD